MAKAKNPVTLCEQFNIDESKLDSIGVLNPTIAIDTSLFIDPMLLEVSGHVEIKTEARQQYVSHFERIIELLQATKRWEDPAWKSARKNLTFPEIPGTCLGYGAAGIRGTGLTGRLTEQVLSVAKQIIDIGVDNPDLFVAMALFEEKIGPDKISDMTTNVILPALSAFNRRVLAELRMTGEKFKFRGLNCEFLSNPFETNRTPIILLPVDILRDLPVANDWDGVAKAASQNAQLRDEVNTQIGEIFAKKTKRDKSRLKSEALSSAKAFQALINAMRGVEAEHYDVQRDPLGLLRWAAKGMEYARAYPLTFVQGPPKGLDDLFGIVKEIVEDFQHLVERRGLNRELYQDSGKPRSEKTAQRLFFAIAYARCKVNDVDISPELDTGNGRVDFKFSKGFSKRVLVEIKLSTNPGVVPGYTSQLEEYRAAEETTRAVYVVIDVGSMGKKEDRLIEIRNNARARGEPLSELEFVDGTIKPPPSKL